MTFLLLACLLGTQEPPEPIVLKGAKIVTMTGQEIESGSILIVGSRIRKVGADVEIPAGAKVIELSRSAHILPGFIDLHSHLGSLVDVDETTEAVTPQVKAVEAFTSQHRDVVAALGSGVTTVALAPGNGNLVGGRVGVIKLNGARYDRALVRDSVAMKLSLGSEALKRDREPTSHAGAVQLLRGWLKDPASGPGALPLFIHADTSTEIQSVLDLQGTVKNQIVLLHAREAWRVARLREAHLTIALGPLSPGDPRQVLETPQTLAKAGVRLAFVSDAPGMGEEHLRVTAAFAVKYGLDRHEALKAMTVTPAEVLGMTHEIGTIEPEKDADLVVWSGPPLTLMSSVELVLVQGKITYRHQEKP